MGVHGSPCSRVLLEMLALQFLSSSRNSLKFLEPQHPFSCSNGPATLPFSKPEQVWMFWRRDEHLVCSGIRTTVRPARSPVGLGLLIRLFPPGFPTKILHVFLFPHTHAESTSYLTPFICSPRSHMVRITYEVVSKSPRTMLITRKSLVVHDFPVRVCCGGVL